MKSDNTSTYNLRIETVRCRVIYFVMIGRWLSESELACVTVYRNFFVDSVEVRLAVEMRFVK
jgi:hypothetical protein